MMVEIGCVIARWMRGIVAACLLFGPLSGNAVTPMIAAGSSSSVFLNSDGSVWVTGSANGYALGATSPVPVLPLSGVVAVGTTHSTHIALLADGTLWGVGGNLGNGTSQNYSQPQRVPGLPAVAAVSVSDHVLALGQDGTVWAWGNNDRGQVGDGSRTYRYTPVQLAGLTNVAKVSAGPTSSLALGIDGTVWVWGWTCCGAAGNGYVPSIETDPEMYHVVPTRVPNLDQIIAISAGNNHHMALRADGTVWVWGVGAGGQNGAGTFFENLVPAPVPGLGQVVAIREFSNDASLALKSDGTVWAWGNNNAGQLGVSAITSSTVPIQVPGVSDAIAVAAGNEYALAMRRDGTVIAWGLNSTGQLGDNTLQSRAQPLAVVGPGGIGQLNLLQPAPASINQLPQARINLSALSGRAPLTVNASAVDASDADGTIRGYSWRSTDGQQGSGPSMNFLFTQAGTYNIDLLIEDNSGGRGSARQQIVVAPAVVSVSAHPSVSLGNNYGVALANDGRILSWGLNGLLGFYDAQAQSHFPQANSLPMANGMTGVMALVSGGTHVHVLFVDGTVSGWGINTFGQVGSGSIENAVQQPQQLANLPPAYALAAGSSHSLALTRDGRVFAWGLNMDGQLGQGDTNNRLQPAEVAGLSGVQAIAAASTFSVALKSDGTVWAWGDNHGQQLGDGTQILRSRPFRVAGLASIAKIFISDFAIFAQKADGTVWVTGSPPTLISGDPGPRQGARHLAEFDGAVSIAGSNRHIVVVRADGSVWTGGQQVAMALGFPDNADVAGLKQLPGISDAVAAAVGNTNSAVLRRDGTVLSWGLNTFGQIGDGTLALRQTPVLVVNETANGFLDLIPETSNTIARDKVPPFFLATYANGGQKAKTLYADLKGIPSGGEFASGAAGKFAAGYNVYVAANVPSIAASSYFQLGADNNWSALSWPMAEFLRGVALDSRDSLVRAQILQDADLSSPMLAGASIIVGYGTDADEMIRGARYRTIFTVPQE